MEISISSISFLSPIIFKASKASTSVWWNSTTLVDTEGDLTFNGVDTIECDVSKEDKDEDMVLAFILLDLDTSESVSKIVFNGRMS